jgi:hypothetical protein
MNVICSWFLGFLIAGVKLLIVDTGSNLRRRLAWIKINPTLSGNIG